VSDASDLRETVDRMEERLRAHPLFPVYERLIGRFSMDLSDERDVLLSRAAVLMLLQETAGRDTRGTGTVPRTGP
jgi:hypothetical protein